MYEKILVPLDSSEVAESVLPYIEELVGHLKSEVTLLYVCKSAEAQNRQVHEVYLGIIAEGVERDIRERYPVKRGARIKVKSVVLSGKPSEEIIDYANENDVSLIVIATHPRFSIMHRTMGQTADKMLQEASVPVLLVSTTKPHPGAGPRQILDRVLLPLDGSEIGETALLYVIELAKKQWTQVTLLQVVTPGQYMHTVGGLNYVRFTEQQIESMKIKAKQYLENVSQKLADAKVFVRCEVRVGDTAKEIINFANEINARLVAISARHQLGIKQWISSSITQKILQATNTPVLLVRAPG